jgi:predicted acylesterase/phospholipase RssA
VRNRFVCATRADTGVNAAVLRSYSSNRPKEVECSIWEAGRATSAASTFFDPIRIGESGEEFIDGATACNNPVEKLFEEARAIWADDQEYCIDCIVSIGTGQSPVKAFGRNLKEVASTLAKISTETQETSDRFSATWARSLVEAVSGQKVYFRFNVDKGLEAVGLEEYKEKAKISASTRVYISGRQVSSDLKECAEILRYKTRPGTDASRVSGMKIFSFLLGFLLPIDIRALIQPIEFRRSTKTSCNEILALRSAPIDNGFESASLRDTRSRSRHLPLGRSASKISQSSQPTRI